MKNSLNWVWFSTNHDRPDETASPDEILELPDDWFEPLEFVGHPMIPNIGCAELPGKFRISGRALVVEPVQIDGGREGVLPTLSSVIERHAKRRSRNHVKRRLRLPLHFR
jgi:hypothetical protein